ncbi:ABC transporter permease [Paenibacillus mucilaginosus]|uniref:Autoinducer 2 import system permease protein LsrD n=2 Tax=Paenibacillus mucilaginosus TaxID=61624 RepID=H6NNP5_9BACL|nr:ABC transporter permease [Paenibacillus mucilaginosus]AEI45700.1 monosaccharide-transporting ATPase [Paenibacillus mucilaginosus KNP414]AFC33366.1 monosaccharide-transporting ATPase [Paenibacillus mucilaginosus 3016]MCG7215111.1 ABC transporter permease [Paenibacillus mucilaginosus]WDM27090.1 ABC transporter permease [Paenibacillus mucilaginosus]WFA21781.1 ABC transporter permease [Paenibacillus mucilaginosus]
MEAQARGLQGRREFSLKNFFLQWEWLLVVILIAINIINANLSPYYLNYESLRDATMSFLDKAFIVLPMVLVMILGDIDISVASTVALTSVIMADLYHLGLPMELSILVGLAVGALCGFINGLLIVKFKELSAVIVTLSTMIIYRGIAYIILEDQAKGNFPEWFSFFGWEYVGGVPFILVVFLIFAAAFSLLLHKTTFGRRVYAIGNNSTASRFSGVQVDKIKVIVFTLTGLMAAVTAIFLMSRMGSTRPNVATGYELDVIAMVVLGGISTAGGKGRMIGAILAVFLIGLLSYGLGLVNVPAQMLLVIIGLLLIFAVMVPKLKLGKLRRT